MHEITKNISLDFVWALERYQVTQVVGGCEGWEKGWEWSLLLFSRNLVSVTTQQFLTCQFDTFTCEKFDRGDLTIDYSLLLADNATVLKEAQRVVFRSSATVASAGS